METLFQKKVEQLKDKRLKLFLTIIERVFFRYLSLYLDFLGDENRMQIKDKGLRVNDTKIKRLGKPSGYVYSPKYESFKGRLGLNTDYVDLSLTGLYLKSIEYKIEGLELIANSDDPKEVYLDAFYSGNSKLIGINKETKKQLLTNMKPNLISLTKKNL